MSAINESHVEEAALTWFGELGYAVAHGPDMAPGEIEAERASFGDVVLIGRLRDAITRLNPTIPEDAREEALRKILRPAGQTRCRWPVGRRQQQGQGEVMLVQ